MLEKGNGISCSKKNRQVLFTLHINICRGIFEPIIRLNIFLFHILRTFRIGKDRQKKKKRKKERKTMVHHIFVNLLEFSIVDYHVCLLLGLNVLSKYE